MTTKRFKDLSGQVFGRLEVLGQDGKIGGRIAWKCRCSCGNVTRVITNNLSGKKTRSCGCLHHELVTKDLTNKIIGKWNVIEKSEKRSKKGYIYWKCRCICGSEKEVTAEALLNGRSQGCIRCARASLVKRFCLHGHDTDIWGRTSSYACRACIKDKHLRTHYGISLNEFISLYEFQGGKCAVCGKKLGGYLPKEPGFGKSCRIEVDHDHHIKDKRKAVRGLLCGGRWAGCNRKLGRIDKLQWLYGVIAYLEKLPAQEFLRIQNT